MIQKVLFSYYRGGQVLSNFNFSRELQKEIYLVEYTLKESLSSWQEEIDRFAQFLEADDLWRGIPEFVILAYEYFGMDRDLSIKIAAIFKMAYLVNFIHETIQDDEEGQEYNQKLQFTILIGDYLLGKTMSLILEAGGAGVVDSFAEMMAEVNEGLIIKHKIDYKSDEVVRKTKASYYGTTLITAARLAGINNESELNIINSLGINIGIAMYLIYTKESHDKISPYVNKVNELFTKVNQHSKVVNSYLEKAIGEISAFSGNLSKRAVI